MEAAQHDKPGEGLHHCETCDKYYKYIDISRGAGENEKFCRFCAPHCFACGGNKNLSDMFDSNAENVLCQFCRSRIVRTCRKCKKVFKDWIMDEADFCENCEGDEDDSD